MTTKTCLRASKCGGQLEQRYERTFCGCVRTVMAIYPLVVFRSKPFATSGSHLFTKNRSAIIDIKQLKIVAPGTPRKPEEYDTSIAFFQQQHDKKAVTTKLKKILIRTKIEKYKTLTTSLNLASVDTSTDAKSQDFGSRSEDINQD
ncbi:hypothetical protein CEXT_759131 [Caerostris extrusa]|uniref:Uncharacterized protein n=1 Tax=Caerostris extrusa TaxID=172846 RepID=A0AAV4YBG4_CAEEX|nr:hypothetical protein CEXT_759131 [Caerostris extrusa]